MKITPVILGVGFVVGGADEEFVLDDGGELDEARGEAADADEEVAVLFGMEERLTEVVFVDGGEVRLHAVVFEEGFEERADGRAMRAEEAAVEAQVVDDAGVEGGVELAH